VDPREAEEALERIDELIRRLKIDFDKFFNGALPTPPETLRFQTFAEVRKLRSEHHKSAVIRFRINSLEAKLNSLSEFFNRRLRDIESGVSQRPRRPGAVRKPTHDPYNGVVIDRQADPRAIEALYSELYGKQGRNAKTDLESFQGFLQKQAEAIRDKTGCDDVVFRVTSKKGKLQLKAKPGQ
jgi:hypothetical protein